MARKSDVIPHLFKLCTQESWKMLRVGMIIKYHTHEEPMAWPDGLPASMKITRLFETVPTALIAAVNGDTDLVLFHM